jgi:hypothetical protein
MFFKKDEKKYEREEFLKKVGGLLWQMAYGLWPVCAKGSVGGLLAVLS